MAQSDTLTITILGCGSSGGVPRIGYGWGACDPDNPRNRRRRCSLLVTRRSIKGLTTVLVDTGPDARAQLLDAHVDWIDGVLYTHEHADHTHGIDELRVPAVNHRRRIDIYADARTLQKLHQSFGYCFVAPEGSDYPPILKEHCATPGTRVAIQGSGGEIVALPFSQHHGGIRSLGFRFANVAYSADVSDLDETACQHLGDLDVWIVDALRYAPHKTHFNVDQALAWIERIKPARAVLTNMHVDLDYATLVRTLPGNVEPAFDGMQITARL